LISSDLIQQEIIDILKADVPLTAVTEDIREANYKGRDFIYPNVRVDLGYQNSRDNGNCEDSHSAINVIVSSNSEKDSSREASQIAGLIKNALAGQRIVGVGWYIATLRCIGMHAPVTSEPNLWRGNVYFRGNIYRSS
jgi:hypothetical protein